MRFCIVSLYFLRYNSNHEAKMIRTWKTSVAGIVMVATSILTAGYLLAAGIGYHNLNAFLFLPFAILPLVGGIIALRRKAWLLSLICSLLSSPPGLVSLVLLALSQEEFKHPSIK